MSDQNKYVNAYIDTSIGMIHENLSVILQTKAQLKVANELLAQKDAVISNLEAQISQFKTDSNELALAKSSASKLESDYNAMKNKVSHMDTLVAQMADMKKIIQQKDSEYNNLVREKDVNYNNMIKLKDAEIESLIQKIADLKANKKAINRTKKQQSLTEINATEEIVKLQPVAEISVNAIQENNDF